VIRNVLGSLALGLAVGLTACSGGEGSGAEDPNTPTPAAGPNLPGANAPGASADDTGSVGLELTLPGGEGVSVVHWTLAGPNNAATVVQSGSVDVHASGGAMFLVSRIAPASGYTMILSAGSTDGGVSCEGSASFAVAPHTTTTVAVQLGCTATGMGGPGTVVSGTLFDCASWNTVTASPAETTVGSSVALGATATAPIEANVTYAWSAPSGQINGASSANATFTCTAPGPVSVTLRVGDGTVPEGSTCNPTLGTDVITITCTGTPPPPAAPALPPWGLLALALGMLGFGYGAMRGPVAAGRQRAL
jgi:hypothetical protein